MLIDKPRNKRRLNLNERMQSNNINQKKTSMDEMNIFNSLGLFDGEKQMKESNKRRVDEKVKNMIRIVGLKISMVHLIPHRLSARLIIFPRYPRS